MQFTFNRRTISQIGFYLLVLAYTVLLLFNLPPGEDARRLPVLILGILLVLLAIRIVLTVYPPAASAVSSIPTRLGVEHLLGSVDEDELENYQESRRSKDTDWRTDMKSATWIVGGLAVIYAFGIFVGGFFFILGYLIIRGDRPLHHNILIATVFIGFLFTVSDLLSIKTWEGLVTLPF